MRGFDFDGCIVPYQSWVKFFLFMVQNQKDKFFHLHFNALKVAYYGMVKFYLLGINDFKINNQLFAFINHLNDSEAIFERYAEVLYQDVKNSWYFSRRSPDDVWLTSSPEVYLKPLAQMLGIKHVIATKVNLNNGNLIGSSHNYTTSITNNVVCYGAEKVNRFKKLFPDTIITEFYTDNIKADQPLIEYAQESFLVKKHQPTQIKFK